MIQEVKIVIIRANNILRAGFISDFGDDIGGNKDKKKVVVQKHQKS